MHHGFPDLKFPVTLSNIFFENTILREERGKGREGKEKAQGEEEEKEEE